MKKMAPKIDLAALPREELKEQLFRKQFKKTQLCRYHASGKCKSGKKCTFAHGASELSVVPNLDKTSMCSAWLVGKCDKGDECKFAHGAKDLRLTPLFKAALLKDTMGPGTPEPSEVGIPLPYQTPCKMSSSSISVASTDIPSIRQTVKSTWDLRSATTLTTPATTPPTSVVQRADTLTPPDVNERQLISCWISVDKPDRSPVPVAQHWLARMALFARMAPECHRDKLAEMLQNAAPDSYFD